MDAYLQNLEPKPQKRPKGTRTYFPPGYDKYWRTRKRKDDGGSAVKVKKLTGKKRVTKDF